MNVITERYKVRTCRQLVVISKYGPNPGTRSASSRRRRRRRRRESVDASTTAGRHQPAAFSGECSVYQSRTLLRRPLPLLRLNKAMSGCVGVCLSRVRSCYSVCPLDSKRTMQENY